jgi:hypothetical protein
LGDIIRNFLSYDILNILDLFPKNPDFFIYQNISGNQGIPVSPGIKIYIFEEKNG